MEGKEGLLARLARQDELTASERKLATHFEANYPHIAFANLAELSSRTALSKATVTRFVRRLGYADFHDFMRRLREEVAQNFDSPLDRHKEDEACGQREPDTLLRRHFESGKIDLQRTLEQADRDCFGRVLELLNQPQRPLYLMSVATGQAVLRYFHLLASYLRGNIHLLDGDTATLPHRIADADERAVLFAVAIDRHPTATFKLLRHFHALGSETILLTNRRNSPLLRYARHPLFVHAERQAVFKSRCAALVLLEALLAGMAAEHRQDGGRYEVMDALSRELDVFIQA